MAIIKKLKCDKDIVRNEIDKIIPFGKQNIFFTAPLHVTEDYSENFVKNQETINNNLFLNLINNSTIKDLDSIMETKFLQNNRYITNEVNYDNGYILMREIVDNGNIFEHHNIISRYSITYTNDYHFKTPDNITLLSTNNFWKTIVGLFFQVFKDNWVEVEIDEENSKFSYTFKNSNCDTVICQIDMQSPNRNSIIFVNPRFTSAKGIRVSEYM